MYKTNAATGALLGFSFWTLCKADRKGSPPSVQVQDVNSDYANSNYEWVDWSQYRKDGTFSPGCFRAKANGTILDNWSTAGNQNPFTGKPGWMDTTNLQFIVGRSIPSAKLRCILGGDFPAAKGRTTRSIK